MCVVESIGYEYTRTDEDEKGQLAYFRSSR